MANIVYATNLSREMESSLIGRFLVDPSPLAGVNVSFAFNFNLEAPDDKYPDIQLAVDVVRNTWNQIRTLVEPYFLAMYLPLEDPMVRALVNRSLYGNNALNEAHAAFKKKVDAVGWCDTRLFVPPYLIGNPNMIVLRDGEASITKVIDFILGRVNDSLVKFNATNPEDQVILESSQVFSDNPVYNNVLLHQQIDPIIIQTPTPEQEPQIIEGDSGLPEIDPPEQPLPGDVQPDLDEDNPIVDHDQIEEQGIAPGEPTPEVPENPSTEPDFNPEQ